ncbi:MAG: GNAT family N-acetyltransferase [Dysgonomonas sp.]
MDTKHLMVEIRQEEANDFPAVYDVNFKAFKRKVEARLVDRLRLSKAFIPELSLVATIGKKVVGHILFTKIMIVDGDKETPSLALAPMAVVPDMQREGVGTKLIHYGFDKAKELGYKSVIVFGHAEYYPKLGFVPTSKWQIKPPYNVPENSFLGIELIKDGLTGVKGTVRYSKEFEEI